MTSKKLLIKLLSIGAISTLLFTNSYSTTINISVANFSFTASTVNAITGDTIKWNWVSGIHTTTCDGSSFTSRPVGAASWNSNLNSGLPTYKYVVTVAGTYNYKCSFHAPGMVGVINVSSPPLILNLTSIIEGFWDGSVMISDTAKVFVHNSTTPFAKVDSATAKLNTSGNAVFNFTNAASGSYYIVVTQRNSLQTWSKTPQTFSSGVTLNYNFTTSADKAFGNNLKLSLGKFTNYSGDENQDGSVDVTDIVNIYNDFSNSGYLNTDVNGDSFVDSSDLIITYNNSINVVSIARP